MLGDLMSSVSPIEVKVLETTKRTTKIAKQVAQIVEKTEGTADVFDGIVCWAIDKYHAKVQPIITIWDYSS
jgi:hypothetical protein